MNFLIDTHIFVWWLTNNKKLSASQVRHLESQRNQVLVSSASIWEISTRFRLGNLPQIAAHCGSIDLAISECGFEPLPIQPREAKLAGEFSIDHRDPFDRMLAAQSIVNQIPIMTNDEAFALFRCKRI